jgi:hypothetical protein
MAAPGPERALWADGLSMTYDGSKFQFQDIDLIVPVGAKIGLLGVRGARCAGRGRRGRRGRGGRGARAVGGG